MRTMGYIGSVVAPCGTRACVTTITYLPCTLHTSYFRYTPGELVPYKWESCYTIQMSSWGYDRTEGITRFWNTTHLLWQLASSASCNGNLLLNVGPTADGRIVPAFEERLLDMGTWLKVRTQHGNSLNFTCKDLKTSHFNT